MAATPSSPQRGHHRSLSAGHSSSACRRSAFDMFTCCACLGVCESVSGRFVSLSGSLIGGQPRLGVQSRCATPLRACFYLETNSVTTMCNSRPPGRSACAVCKCTDERTYVYRRCLVRALVYAVLERPRPGQRTSCFTSCRWLVNAAAADGWLARVRGYQCVHTQHTDLGGVVRARGGPVCSLVPSGASEAPMWCQ